MKEKICLFFDILKNKVQKNVSIQVGMVLIFFLLCFGWTLFNTSAYPSLDDPFFHIRFAEMIRQHGFGVFKEFHWLYFSKITSNYYLIYYNFLFYLILIPFTFINPLALGIKFYGVIFSALAFTMLFVFLKKINEKHAFCWLFFLLAAINYEYLIRFFMMRPFAFAPILLIFELYFLYRQKYFAVFLISFVYLFWHSVTFVFPLGVAIVYFLFDAYYGKKNNWKILASSFAGVFLATIFAQFFAGGFYNFIKDIYIGMYSDTILGNKVAIAEGSELYAADIFTFVRSNALLVVMFFTAVSFEIAEYLKKRGMLNLAADEKQKIKSSLFLLSIVFFLGNFLSRRNGDFFVFFVIPYIVISLNAIATDMQLKLKKFALIGIGVASIYLFSANLLFIDQAFSRTGAHDKIEGAATWMKNNTPKGSVVFHPTWNFFPTLFYFDQNNYYIAGIEPRFLYDFSPRLYWLWWNISQKGYECEQEDCQNFEEYKNKTLKDEKLQLLWYNERAEKISQIIRDDFKSEYILTSSEFKDFNKILEQSKYFEKVYEDQNDGPYSVYKIVNQ